MTDLISRKALLEEYDRLHVGKPGRARKMIEDAPSAQPEYEELTPEEAASEIASGSIMSARYWLDAMIQLKQMGYAICRKR